MQNLCKPADRGREKEEAANQLIPESEDGAASQLDCCKSAVLLDVDHKSRALTGSLMRGMQSASKAKW
jgi:hypothetical protein